MNSQHKAIRTLLTSMSPRRAEAYIKAFALPQEEEHYLMECDVRRKSYVEAAHDNSTTPETIKRRRQRAYAHIADEIIHAKS